MRDGRSGVARGVIIPRALKLFLTVVALLGLAQPANAALVQINALELVMAGSSSSGSNQVWLRIVGQPSGVPADCVYGSSSLFFVDASSGVNPDSFLSILLTAKTSNRPVIIVYDIDTTGSDFFYFGITKCRMSRIALQ